VLLLKCKALFLQGFSYAKSVKSKGERESLNFNLSAKTKSSLSLFLLKSPSPKIFVNFVSLLNLCKQPPSYLIKGTTSLRLDKSLITFTVRLFPEAFLIIY